MIKTKYNKTHKATLKKLILLTTFLIMILNTVSYSSMYVPASQHSSSMLTTELSSICNHAKDKDTKMMELTTQHESHGLSLCDMPNCACDHLNNVQYLSRASFFTALFAAVNIPLTWDNHSIAISNPSQHYRPPRITSLSV